ncbi:hypothetical protein ACG2LH_07650 [Zhouia sp. PK063]|uniref:hypothetical protein n=1 Tax=Zhouia sp. PK063 TaxID=3373602 RepID=UPI0037AF6685
MKADVRKELCIAICILISPFLAYFYLLVPNNITKMDLLGIEFTAGIYQSFDMLFYNLGLKLFPILLLILFYLSTFTKWRYSILILLSIFINLFIFLITKDVFYIKDFYSYILSGVFIVSVLYFVGVKSYNNYLIGFEKSLLIKINFKKSYYFYLNKKIKLEQEKSSLKKNEYLKRLILLSKQISKSKEGYEIIGVNKELKTKKIVDFLILVVLLTLSVLQITMQFIPRNTKEIDFFIFKIYNYGFPDAAVFYWFFINKISIVIFLSIWFLINNQWWKYIILCPLIVSVYQFMEVVMPAENVDDSSFWYSLPYILIFSITLIYFSTKLKYLQLNENLEMKLELEIDQIIKEIKNNKKQELSTKLKHLIYNQSQYTAQEYLEELMKLQQKVANE